MFCNLFIQDSSTQMKHLFLSKVLLLLPNFPAGLTEAPGSQVTCPGQTASVARNRLEPVSLLAPYPAPDHAPSCSALEINCAHFSFLSTDIIVNPPRSPTTTQFHLCGFLLNTGFGYLEVIKIYITMCSRLIFPEAPSSHPSLEINDLANISTSGVHISSTTSSRKKECNSFATCALSNFNCY